MINVFVHAGNAHTLKRLTRAGKDFGNIRAVTYQDAFRNLSFPSGTLVFTDFDFLDAREMEIAAAMAVAAKRADTDVRILNHPAHACERYDLLRKMFEIRLSPVSVCRVSDHETPAEFPVFIRSEDGASGPETGLLHNEAEYRAKIAEMREAGKPAKGRIAIKFDATADENGYFRKYGVLRIGDRVIPQHIHYSKDWNVKSSGQSRDEALATEELDYIRDNPHRDRVMEAFDVANLQFGRADFACDKGRFVLFEINTNPTFPRFRRGSSGRAVRRDLLRTQILEAFEAIDSPETRSRRIRFDPPRPYRNYIDTKNWGFFSRMALYQRLLQRQR
jgi:hypothetical protein